MECGSDRLSTNDYGREWSSTDRVLMSTNEYGLGRMVFGLVLGFGLEMDFGWMRLNEYGLCTDEYGLSKDEPG